MEFLETSRRGRTREGKKWSQVKNTYMHLKMRVKSDGSREGRFKEGKRMKREREIEDKQR